MKIWDDEIVKRLYFRLSSNEIKGLELAVRSLRKSYPKIDIYESILGGGPAISAGKKQKNKSKGRPLFVITIPKKTKPACIKLRIDSKKDRKEIEDAVGIPWEELNSMRFNLKNFQRSLDQFNAFLTKLNQSANVVESRSDGNSHNPSDYYIFTDYPAENEQGLLEGAQITVSVNKHERNCEARRKCIAHHGAKCFFCGFDYGQKYGDAYAGFIHVHHIVPLSEINKEYEVQPENDLVPVCPNCHAVIHFGGETLPLKEAISLLSPHNNPGSADA